MNPILHLQSTRHATSTKDVSLVAYLASILMLFCSLKGHAEDSNLVMTAESTYTFLFEEQGQWYYGSNADGSGKVPFNGTITGTFNNVLNVKSTTGETPTLTINNLTAISTKWTKNLKIYEGATVTINLTGKNEWKNQDSQSISIENNGKLTLNNQGTFQMTGEIINKATGTLKLTNEDGKTLLILGGILATSIKNENTAEGSLVVPTMLEWISNNLQGKKVKWSKQGLFSEPVEFQMPANRSAIMTVVEPNENYTFFIEDKHAIANISGTDKYTSFFTATEGNTSHYYTNYTTTDTKMIKNWQIYGATAHVVPASDAEGAASADVVVNNEMKHFTVNTARGLAWIAQVTNIAGSEMDGFKGCTIELGKDIDGSKTATGLSGTFAWIPIGNSNATPFIGNFNGTGKTVKGLEMMSNSIVTKTDENHYIGLFGCVEGSKFENLVVSNFSSFKNTEATAKNIYLSAIAGYANNATFSNCNNQKSLLCSVSDNVTDRIWIGGIVGLLEGNSSIANCSNINTLTDKYNSVSATSDKSICAGGIAGEITENIPVTNCFNSQTINTYTASKTNDIKLTSYSGGIIGKNQGTVSNCYSTGTVSTFSTQLVAEKIRSGGLAGLNTGTINNCYASGSVKINSNNDFDGTNFSIGGIAAINSGSISNCIYFQKTPADFAIKNKQGKASRISTNEGEGSLSNNYANASLVVSPERKATGKEDGEDAFLRTDLSTILTNADIWGFTAGKLPTLKAFSTDQAANNVANNLPKLDSWDDYAQLAHVDVAGSDVALTLTGDVATGFTVKTAKGLAWIARVANGTRTKDYNNPYYPEKQGFEGCTVELAADIDLATAPEAMTDKSWIPIGLDKYYSFKGLFEGKGHLIKGLEINLTEDKVKEIGLFGRIKDAIIQNVGLELGSKGINVVAKATSYTSFYIGGLVGQIEVASTNPIVRNCYVSGIDEGISISGKSSNSINMGGVVGYAGCDFGINNVFIENCYSSIDVKKEGEGSIYLGGILGDGNIAVSYCYATGNLTGSTTGTSNVGGISGSGNATIQKCFALNPTIQGKVGNCNRAIRSEYSITTLNLPNYAGTLIKVNNNQRESANFYANTLDGANSYIETYQADLKKDLADNKGWNTAWIFSEDKLPQLKMYDNGSYIDWGKDVQPAFSTADYLETKNVYSSQPLFITAENIPTANYYNDLNIIYENGDWYYNLSGYSNKGKYGFPFNGIITSGGVEYNLYPITITGAEDATTLTFKNLNVSATSKAPVTIAGTVTIGLDETNHLSGTTGLKSNGTLTFTATEQGYLLLTGKTAVFPESNISTGNASVLQTTFTNAPGAKSYTWSTLGDEPVKKSFTLKTVDQSVELIAKPSAYTINVDGKQQIGYNTDNMPVSTFATKTGELTAYTNLSDLKTVEIGESTTVSYESEHKGKQIVVKNGGTFNVNAKDAAVLGLEIETGAQVTTNQLLTVYENFTTTRTLYNKWSTFAAPVPMTATVADDSKRLYTANGYLTAGTDAQKWSSLSGAEGETAIDFTAAAPYLIAAESEGTEATFKATGVTIPAAQEMKLGEALANGVFLFVANSSLQNQKLSGIYMLNAKKNCFELKEGETIVGPMQAFIVANAVTQAAIKSLTLTAGSMPTANEQAIVNKDARIYGADGQLCISLDSPAEVTVFNTAGQLIRRIQAIAGDTQTTLPSGIYLIRCHTITYKIKL